MGNAATPIIPNFTTQTASQYKANIDAGFAVTDRIAWAFAPHEQAVPDMTVRVEAGAIFDGTALVEFPARTTVVIAAPTTNPRIDRVMMNNGTGGLYVATGIEAANPTPPPFPGLNVPIAQVSLVVGQTAITNADITDERNLGTLGLGALALRDTVATNDLDDDAVTLAKLGPGAAGGVLGYDGAGDPVHLAAGAAGQVLTSNGAGATPGDAGPARSRSSLGPGLHRFRDLDAAGGHRPGRRPGGRWWRWRRRFLRRRLRVLGRWRRGWLRDRGAGRVGHAERGRDRRRRRCRHRRRYRRDWRHVELRKLPLRHRRSRRHSRDTGRVRYRRHRRRRIGRPCQRPGRRWPGRRDRLDRRRRIGWWLVARRRWRGRGAVIHRSSRARPWRRWRGRRGRSRRQHCRRCRVGRHRHRLGVCMMPRYARIEGDVVVEIAGFDTIEDRFHPMLTWVKTGPEVAEGWRHDAVGKTFSPPPGPPPAEAVRRRLTAVDALRADKLTAGFRYIDGALYDAGDAARLDIVEITTGIVAGTGLPGGGATFTYRDMAGVGHAFDGPAFLAFAAALRDWVGAVRATARTHQQAIQAIADDPGLAKEQKTARIEAHDIARDWPA